MNETIVKCCWAYMYANIMLVRWQCNFSFGLYREVLSSKPRPCVLFCIFHSYSVVWEHDILDPHPAASLDLNNKLKSSTDGIEKKVSSRIVENNQISHVSSTKRLTSGTHQPAAMFNGRDKKKANSPGKKWSNITGFLLSFLGACVGCTVVKHAVILLGEVKM